MRYFLAILHTVLLVVMPLIMIPFFQWYKKTLGLQDTDLAGVYLILFFIGSFMLILTILRWISAIADKDIKNLI